MPKASRSTNNRAMDHLMRERKKLHETLSKLTPEQWVQGGVIGGKGSIKDGLADVIAHEQGALQTLQFALRGIPFAGEYKDLETFNQRVIQDNRSRPVKDLLEVWDQSYQKLLSSVSHLNNKDLSASSSVSKTAGAAIEDILRTNSYGLYAALRAEVETYTAT